MTSLRVLLAPAAGAAALALSACGAGPGPVAASQTGSQPGPGAVTFAVCMSSHGLSQFPDPGAPAAGGSQVSILGSQLPPRINVKAPSFQAALKTCMARFLAAHPRPPVSAAQKAALLRHARCMRAHGVPNFPDPRFPAGGGIAVSVVPDASANSPAFERAQ